MPDGTDGLNAADLPRDKNLSTIQTGHHIQVVKQALTGAGGVGDDISITVPAGAIHATLYVLDSSNAALGFEIDDIQSSPVSGYWPATFGPLRFGCQGHTTIAGTVLTGDLADAATATVVAIFMMGKARG